MQRISRLSEFLSWPSIFLNRTSHFLSLSLPLSIALLSPSTRTSLITTVIWHEGEIEDLEQIFIQKPKLGRFRIKKAHSELHRKLRRDKLLW